MDLFEHLTVAKAAMSKQTIRGSRFIACVFPISQAEDADARMIECRKAHVKANHHCFAYTLGIRQHVQKASDDGEPSGTAGAPLLDLLKTYQICDTLLIVTRYFGGIKLGTGGLIRAYTHSGRAALLAAGIVARMPSFLWKVRVDYHMNGALNHLLCESPCTIEDTAYADAVTYTLSLDQRDGAALEKAIREQTNGQAYISRLDTLYREQDVTGTVFASRD
ncbi:MAG: YigZ family protein [Sporolactobacillus sp.]